MAAKTFSEIYQQFVSEQDEKDSFTAACNVWLELEECRVRKKESETKE